MKKILIYCLLVNFVFLSCKTTEKQDTKNSKPNILILHVDDLGFHDVGFNGSKIYQTPNIDKLSKESIAFNNAYANYPRCVPSRYAMLTSTYPVKDGDVPDDGFSLTSIDDNKNYIKHIDQLGYQTAYFGKWHLGGHDSKPTDFGFDVSVAAGKAGSPISFLYPFNTPKGKNKKVKKAPIEDLEELSKEGDYLTDVLTDQVIKYIKNTDKDKPFMAMLAFYNVHQPLEAKKQDIERNKAQIKAFDYGNQPEYINEGTGRTKMRQDHPKYAAMVENTDENIGRLLNLLKELNIDDNTIVIFSSDHGGLSNDGYNKRQLATSNYPLRAGKGWMYEGGIKVPFLIKYPNHFKPRVDNNSLVMLMDVFPTLLDIIDNKQLESDGKSMLPVITQKEIWNNRTVYWHQSKARPRNTGESNSSVIRSGDWKLHDFYETNKIELYNIKEDPSEQNNLAKTHPEKVKNLLDNLNTWKSNF